MLYIFSHTILHIFLSNDMLSLWYKNRISMIIQIPQYAFVNIIYSVSVYKHKINQQKHANWQGVQKFSDTSYLNSCMKGYYFLVIQILQGTKLYLDEYSNCCCYYLLYGLPKMALFLMTPWFCMYKIVYVLLKHHCIVIVC